MSWIAVTLKVLTNQQFGALPLRSATVTLDIKKAFQAVLPGRLVCRLREQVWPDLLVRWIISFATGRRVHIRLDGEIGSEIQIECGLPQGSPVAPIFFMLYIAPLFFLDDPCEYFGYADDAAKLEISTSLSENAQKLSACLEQALEWGKEEGITFDPDKSELIHFSRKIADQQISPPVVTSTLTVTECTPNPQIRWLGVISYNQATKALKIGQALARLGNTARGVGCRGRPKYCSVVGSTAGQYVAYSGYCGSGFSVKDFGILTIGK
jgi:hypothetical protein